MPHTPAATTLRRAAILAATLPLVAGCFAVRREADQNALVDLERLERAEAQTNETTYRSARLEGAGLRTAEPPVKAVTRQEATGGLRGIAVAPDETPLAPRPGRTPADAPDPIRIDQRPDSVVVAPLDALVGQISGRPLFASDFFEPMDARMLAEAQLKGQREFLIGLQEQISAALRDVIRDELLLAEFEATLSPEQRSGLAAFVQGVREDLIRQSGGSSELANASLLTAEGLTLDEKVEAESRQQLVRQMVGQLLRHRAYIPWRDVRRAYLKDLSDFRPPATARLRMIRTPSDEPAVAAAVQRDLAEGIPFATVAEQHSDFRPEQGGLYEVVVAPEGYASTEIFSDPTLNAQAAALEAGEVAGPIDWNGRRVWLTLESLAADDISLYDAQDRILSVLRQERLAEVQSEFFRELERRGSLSDIDRMEAELFRLGAERYLISARAAEPAAR